MGTAAIQFGSLFWADLFVLKIKPSICRWISEESRANLENGSQWSAAVVCTLKRTHADADLYLGTHRSYHKHKEPVSGQPAWRIDSAALLGSPDSVAIHLFTGESEVASSRDSQCDHQHQPSH